MQAFTFGSKKMILLKTNFERKIGMSAKSFGKRRRRRRLLCETFWFDFCSGCFGYFNMPRKMPEQIDPTKFSFPSDSVPMNLKCIPSFIQGTCNTTGSALFPFLKSKQTISLLEGYFR